jgi:hypothetical protein
MGVTRSGGAQDWPPTKDLYEFAGTTDQDAISGDLVRKIVDDATGRSTSKKVVLKREATKSSADNTSYDDWIRNWDLRMKARGPRLLRLHGVRFEPRPDVNIITIICGVINLVIALVFREGRRLDEGQFWHGGRTRKMGVRSALSVCAGWCRFGDARGRHWTSPSTMRRLAAPPRSDPK